MITAQKLLRAEIWDKPQAAAGVRLAILAGLSRLQGTAQLAGDHVLEGSIALDSAAVPDLLTHRVLRVDDGTTFDEWLISSIRKNSVMGTVDFSAAPLSNLLGYRALVSQTDAAGVVRFNFDLVGLKPSEIIDAYVLPALTAAGVAWVARGVIDQDVATDITFDWDTPLSVVKTLASRQGLEFQLRRNGVVGYYIDLVTAIGSAAGVVDVRYAKNLLNHDQQRVVDQQVTRVFPRGADEEGYRATMARATWRVASVAANVVGLADPLGGDGPILFDGQLVGNYFRTATGALTLVTASSAGAQTITVASAAGVAVNDLVQFRLNAAGHDLTFLTSPADEAGDAKTIVGALDLPDVPSTNNVLTNPALRNWSAGLPVGWAKIGTPTVTQQVAAPYVRTAGSSARVQAAADGHGLVVSAGKVFPLVNAPYISGFASFWVVSGKVRVELVLTHAGGPTVIPIPPQYATSDKLGEWVDVGVSAYNAYSPDIVTAVAVRVVAHQGAAEFYLDAAQVTETPGHKPFVEGSGGTRLWQLGNERLRLYSGVFVTENIDIVDLYRLDGTTWAESKVELGAQIRVTDARMLAAAYQTRIVTFTRDYLTDGSTSVVLSTRPEDLTGSLAKPPRPPRLTLITPGDEGEGTGPSIVASAIETDFDVTLNYLISATVAWYTVDDGADIPLAVGSGQLVISRNDAGGLTKKYVLTAERASQQFSFPLEVAPMTVDPTYLTPTGSVVKADKLTTARTLWGNSFDGTANVTGPIQNNSYVPASAGQVIMRGGTTGWKVRNNADSFDNLVVADNGATSARGDVTAPDFVLGSGSGGSPGPAGSPVEILDEGVSQTTEVTSMDFTGPGVVASHTGSAVTINVPHTWGSLVSKPTTIGGFGITDFNSLGDARWARPNVSNPWTAAQGFGNYINLSFAGPTLYFTNTSASSKEWRWAMAGTTMQLVESGVNDWFSVAAGGAALFRGSLTGAGLVAGDYFTTLGTSGLSGWYTAPNAKGLLVKNTGGSNKVAVTLDATNTWQFGDGLPSQFNGAIIIPNTSYFRGNVTYGFRFNNAADTLNLMILNDAGLLTLWGGLTTIKDDTIVRGVNAAATTQQWAIGSVLGLTGTGSTTTGGFLTGGPMFFYTNGSGTAKATLGTAGDFTAVGVIHSNSPNGLAIGSIGGVNRLQWNSSYFQFVSTADILTNVQARQYWSQSGLTLRNDALSANYGSFTRYQDWLGSGTDNTPTFGAYSGFGFYWAVGGATTRVMSMSSVGTLQTIYQIRALGWYDSEAGTFGGLATEIGVSSGFAYVMAYNRNAGSYGQLIVQGSSVSINTPTFGTRVDGLTCPWHIGGTAPVSLSNSSNGYPMVGYNFYGTNVSGGWAYRANDSAQSIFFQDNLMRFFMAASGSTAGTITWSEQFRITRGSRVDAYVNMYAPDFILT